MMPDDSHDALPPQLEEWLSSQPIQLPPARARSMAGDIIAHNALQGDLDGMEEWLAEWPVEPRPGSVAVILGRLSTPSPARLYSLADGLRLAATAAAIFVFAFGLAQMRAPLPIGEMGRPPSLSVSSGVDDALILALAAQLGPEADALVSASDAFEAVAWLSE